MNRDVAIVTVRNSSTRLPNKAVMEINERNIKMWSTIGPRATLGIAALDLAKKNEN